MPPRAVTFAHDTKHGSVIRQARPHPSSADQLARFQKLQAIHDGRLQATPPHDRSFLASSTGSPSAATTYGTGTTQDLSRHATREPSSPATFSPHRAAHVLSHNVTQVLYHHTDRGPARHAVPDPYDGPVPDDGYVHPLLRGNRVPQGKVKENYDLLAAGGGMPPRGSLGALSGIYHGGY